MRIASLAATLLLTVATAVAQISPTPPLQITFELQPDTTLPGIPVSFHFTINNPTTSPQTVPKELVLMVTDRAGNTFPAACCFGSWWNISAQNDWPDDPIAPRKSSIRDIFTSGQMRRPAWFADGRLSQPGIYQLQAWFVVGTLRESFSLEDIRQRSIVTNSVVLTVQEPHGVDAEVFQQMLNFCKGKWSPTCLGSSSSETLIRRIVSQYPRSDYAGWFATMSTATSLEERASVLRDWLTQAPEDAYTGWRRLVLAEYEIGLMQTYGSAKAEAHALHQTTARDILTTLIRNTKIDAVRIKAQDRLDYLNEPEGDN